MFTLSMSSSLVPTLPTCGKVNVMICPAYDGSVRISSYPVIAVLKQTSPTACPVAPSPKPSRTVPSASTNSAVGLGSAQALPAEAAFDWVMPLLLAYYSVRGKGPRRFAPNRRFWLCGKGILTMDRLSAFCLFAVTAMVVFYAFENRSPWFVLAIAGACALGPVYGFLQGAWPFGLVEAVWTIIALGRW